jgi:UrcA family protein
MKMTAFYKLTLAAAVLAATATPAFAENSGDDTVVTGDRQDAVSIKVYYSDLNLASDKGVQRLERRVRSAARQICITSGVKPLGIWALENQCFEGAMSGAEPQIAEAVRNYGTPMAMGASAIELKRKPG